MEYLDKYQGFIPTEDYHKVVKLTQLVCVDLLIKCDNKYLLGKRTNNPAKGLFFVPGGKIYNNETIPMGLKRVAKNELGLQVSDDDVKCLGLYEHFYDNNFMNNTIGTHCVVIAYEISIDNIDDIDLSLFASQHDDMKWLSKKEIFYASEVHKYVKEYFTSDPYNRVI